MYYVHLYTAHEKPDLLSINVSEVGGFNVLTYVYYGVLRNRLHVRLRCFWSSIKRENQSKAHKQAIFL